MKKPYQSVSDYIANSRKVKPIRTTPKDPTFEYIHQLLDDMIKKSGKPSPFIEDWTEHSKYGYSLIGKTEEELNEILPDGCYTLGDKGGICYMTGKGGMIRFIQNIPK